MSVATQEKPEVMASEQPQLEANLSSRWALAPWHLLAVALWCLFFYTINWFPLRETDLWCHVAYGNWILEHRALPTEDPFMPLAAGMQVLDSAWLSQILLAVFERVGGGEALSSQFTLVTVGMYLLLALAFFRQSRSLVVTYVALLMVLIIGWSRISTIRPENYGTLLFAALIWLLVAAGQSEPGVGGQGRRAPWWLWAGLIALMALWANLHGSFLCGLTLLGCMFLGAVAEAAWRTRRLRGVIDDADVRRWLWICEVAVLGTLINPYGIDLLLYTSLFSINTNLYEISEWQALELIDTGGPAFSMSVIVLMFAFRHSRRRIPVAHVILLLVFTAGVVRGIRMIWWYGAVFGLVVVPHLANLWQTWQPAWWGRVFDDSRQPTRGIGRLPRGRSWSYSLLALLLIWVTFALSPTGRPWVGDKPREPERLYTASTPWRLTAFLREHPPQGQVVNPQWWGDWLVWDGPRDMQVFVTTNVHLVPRQTWRDYRVIRETRSGWANVMNRYRTQYVILDKSLQTTLLRYLRNSPEWRVAYEDEQSAMFRYVAGAAGAREKIDINLEIPMPEDSREEQERSGKAGT